jgi:hypothetical protein
MASLEPQILGALIGASVTFVVSIVVLIFTNRSHDKRQQLQHKHENEIAMAKFYREKIEDIYMSFSTWQRKFGAIYIGLIGYVKGELSENDAYGMFNNLGESDSINKVEMLISLYFPRLISQYKTVMDQRGKIVEYFPPNRSLIGEYSGYCSDQQSFEKKAIKFKEALKEEIDKL